MTRTHMKTSEGNCGLIRFAVYAKSEKMLFRHHLRPCSQSLFYTHDQFDSPSRCMDPFALLNNILITGYGIIMNNRITRIVNTIILTLPILIHSIALVFYASDVTNSGFCQSIGYCSVLCHGCIRFYSPHHNAFKLSSIGIPNESASRVLTPRAESKPPQTRSTLSRNHNSVFSKVSIAIVQ